MKTVAGKTVLVTGAAMGLGKLFAQKAVDEKARTVVVWDIDEKALGQTVAELEAAGGVVHGDVVDVAGPEAVAAAVARVRADVGTVEIVFNNAGIVRGNGYFWETSTVRDIEQTMAINSLAPMFLAREFLPAMIDSDADCRIVNIASSAGLLANPRMAVYAASKWALVGWSDSVRLELAQAGHDKVKVTTVCPTYINTGMFDGAKGILFTPMLKQEAVVAATWRGMLQGEPFVVMPWTSRLNNAVKGLLPVKVRDFYLDRAGVYHSMDSFTGHRGT
ncbi:MAG: SDR family NAD(P)-dependent oxidoreductase [Kineosporiaceae bacterium]